MRVLIADDDPAFRRTLGTLLRAGGHEAVAASDGEEALALFSTPDAPRVALLDWSMPGRSGPELCRELRQPGRPYTYVILLTGRTESADRIEGLDAGADDYLSKPFDPRELEARLRTAQRILALDTASAARAIPVPQTPTQTAVDLDSTGDFPLSTPTGLAEQIGPWMRTPEPLVGSTIAGGKYELEAVIGEGGSGVVYRAFQRNLGRRVAIKVLHPLYKQHPRLLGRFEREARAASRLDHPHIARVFDFENEPDGLAYLVMELLSGDSLDKLIPRGQGVGVERALDLTSQVLSALATAHDAGVVHRDVKPENVIVLGVVDDAGVRCERVKVCDFGIAKLIDGPASGSRLTQEGVICGTPQYMAPEQAAGREVDPRADQYSCAVVLYELLTGRPPFESESAVEVMTMHVFEEPPSPRLVNPAVSPALEAAVLRALAKEPSRRFASARAFRDELGALAG